jgi:hypothetical protein
VNESSSRWGAGDNMDPDGRKGPTEGSPNEPVSVDLMALKSVSAQELPSVQETVEAIRGRAAEKVPPHSRIWRGIMSGWIVFKSRPAFVALAMGVVVVAVFLVLPVSYDRLTGYDVSLTLQGGAGGVGSPEIAAIARSLKARVGAPHVQVDAIAEGGAPKFILHASSGERSRAKVVGAAEQLARELASKSIAAAVQVSAHKERVRYLMAAYALDQIIQVSVDGKSAAELQSEIQQRLAAAGVSDMQVSVTDRPEGGREITLKVERQRDASTGTPETELPQLVLTKDGVPLTGGLSVKVKKIRREGAGTELVVDVTSNGKVVSADIPNADAMSDADIATAIASQLRAGGIDVQVTVQNGEIKIDPAK